jgi:integrase
MAIEKLTALKVERAKKPGWYSDGAGLYLRVAPGGSKQWVFRYTRGDKTTDYGIGPLHTFGLAEARERARQCRQQLCDGIDPLVAKRERVASARVAEAKAVTFRECAEQYLKANDGKWSNALHAKQWGDTLALLYPELGDLPVAAIDKTLVIKALEPIFERTPVTGQRLRGRLENVLAYATVRGYRGGDNPASWDLLKHAGLAMPDKVKHHATVPYRELPAALAGLQDDMAGRCIRFLALTATRLGEASKAQWSEIEGDVWTIPAERMKARKPHVVPLSAAARACLPPRGEKARENNDELSVPERTDYVFPSPITGGPLSDNTLWKAWRTATGATLHGLRSCFRDWAAEQTAFPHEVCEMALAHAIPSAVEKAYRRGDLFEKRRRLMGAWGEFCTKSVTGGHKVVAIRS